jgi:cytochrome bd-type quinol oxidase subunit 2
MTEQITEQERMRKLLPYYLLFIALGFIFFKWGWPAFTAFVQKQKPEIAILIYLSILVILALPGLPLGVYGFRMAHRIIATGQVPPRMKELMRGSKLDESALARRTGRLVYFMSIVLIICSIAAVILCYKLYRSFENHQHKSFSSPKVISFEKH